MATFTPSWTEGVEHHASSSIADAGNAQDNIDLDNLGYYAVDIQIDLDISSGSPSGDCTIEGFGSVDSGSNFDTEPVYSEAVNFAATGNKITSFRIEGKPFIRVRVTNNTGASVTYVGRYAGLQQTSA